MITGLSAFPLTPLHDDRIDKPAFTNLIRRLVAARVDSITVLGSTGSYAYLTAEERAIAVRIAVENAGSIPVYVGVGALRTSHVLDHIERAEAAGASGLLLAPMSYQPLTEDDVYELFRTVSTHTELPVIVYDNPGTTHFQFSHELYARLSKLPGVASIKIPGVPVDPAEARALVAQIRAEVPAHVSIGVSGDRFAAAGFAAGCDAWYSVIGGTLPEAALTISRPAVDGDFATAQRASDALEPLWNAFAEFGGSYRVTAAIAEHLGLAQQSSLPLPIQGLTRTQRADVETLIDTLDLTR